MLRYLAPLAVVALVSGCATGGGVAPEVRAQLAPTGELRAGMNTGNTLFTTKEASGELRGVSVDIMTELARRLGVPLKMVVYPTPGEVADEVGADKWDVAILAIEQTRAEKIAFTPPMTQIEASYLVPPGSPLKRVDDIDAPGMRVAVAEKAGYDPVLTRSLKHAKLQRAKGQDATFAMFRDEKLDAMAGLKPVLLGYQQKFPGSQVVEGRFMTVTHGLGTPRARTAAAEYLKAFVEDMNKTGFIAKSIERHQVKGLSPAQ